MRNDQDEIDMVEDEFLFVISEMIANNGDKKRVLELLQKVVAVCVSTKFT